MISVIINNQPYLDNIHNTYIIDGDDRNEAICAAIDQYIEDTDCTRKITSIICDGEELHRQEKDLKVVITAPARYWNTIRRLHLQ